MIKFKLTFWRREYLRQDELNNSEIRCHRDKPNVLNYSTPASRAPRRPANPPPTTNTRKDQMEHWLVNNLFINFSNIYCTITWLIWPPYLFTFIFIPYTSTNTIKFDKFFKILQKLKIYWKTLKICARTF